MIPPDQAQQPAVTPRGYGFVAGTLVQTSQGLVPIETLAVGDLVLSQPQMGGPAIYKPVVGTIAHDDQVTLLVEYLILEEPETRPLVATYALSFWVEDAGWTAVEDLDYGNVFRTVDGRENVVICVRRLFQTDVEDVGYTHDDGRDKGPTIDLRNAAVQVTLSGEDTYNDFAFRHRLPLRRRVYNIEVAETHTFCVGEPGVWVGDATAARPSGESGR